ncbi:DivIVA domain-containing protein, partial [candidate division GN15 bacterium]|nr:DivIVA domain-containing protein [candidate division GN15 bacterium]
MDLSPNDIRSYQFPNQMRGYDREEVDGFREQMAQAFETLKQEQVKLSMENESLKNQLAALKQFEDTI